MLLYFGINYYQQQVFKTIPPTQKMFLFGRKNPEKSDRDESIEGISH